MKQIKLLLFALCTILLAACSGSKPSSTVKAFLKDIQKEKYTEAAKLIYVEDSADAEEIVALCEKLGSCTKEKGGIKSYEIVSEEIAENGETATVKVQITYNDMPENSELDVQPDIDTYRLRKIDKQWKIDLSQK